MSDLLDALAGGDRRSIGKSDAIVRKVLREPARFGEIVHGLRHDSAVVRMRCADAAEKVSRARPDLLQPHKRDLLALAAVSVEQELCWHLAQMLPRLALEKEERRRVQAIMFGYLEHESRIVRTFAMQALADLSGNDRGLRRRLLPLFEELARTGTAAVRARARKLISSFREA
jgi:hypothetical protein